MFANSIVVVVFVLLIPFGSVLSSAGQVTVSGELKKWHRVTLTFDGPETSEKATPNPFLDYRLDVTFQNGDKRVVVPGFYAADGNAGETSATAGNKWRVYFMPDSDGIMELSSFFSHGRECRGIV